MCHWVSIQALYSRPSLHKQVLSEHHSKTVLLNYTLFQKNISVRISGFLLLSVCLLFTGSSLLDAISPTTYMFHGRKVMDARFHGWSSPAPFDGSLSLWPAIEGLDLWAYGFRRDRRTKAESNHNSASIPLSNSRNACQCSGCIALWWRKQKQHTRRRTFSSCKVISEILI